MSNDDNWIMMQVASLQKQHPLVSEVVAHQIGQLLVASLSERQLPQSELKVAAGKLIADMIPIRPKVEVKE